MQNSKKLRAYNNKPKSLIDQWNVKSTDLCKCHMLPYRILFHIFDTCFLYGKFRVISFVIHILVLLLILVVWLRSIGLNLNLYCYHECIDCRLSNFLVILLIVNLIGPVTWYPAPTRTIVIHNFANMEPLQFVIQSQWLSFSYNQRLLVIHLVAKVFY